MFINETKNDYENNLQVSRTIGKKIQMWMALAGAVFIVLGILWIAFFPEDIGFSVFLFVMAAFFLAFSLYFFDWLVRRNLKKHLKGKEAEVKYSFYEDHFEIDGMTETGMSEHAQGAYSDFTSVVEYDEFWLLYYNRYLMYILRKDGMTEGRAEDLSVFLGVKMGSLYKNKVKKKKTS